MSSFGRSKSILEVVVVVHRSLLRPACWGAARCSGATVTHRCKLAQQLLVLPGQRLEPLLYILREQCRRCGLFVAVASRALPGAARCYEAGRRPLRQPWQAIRLR